MTKTAKTARFYHLIKHETTRYYTSWSHTKDTLDSNQQLTLLLKEVKGQVLV